MYHFFEAVTNSKGASLPGYFGRLIDPTSGAVVSIYADSASTPIVTASGVVNMAKTDDVGNLSLYVAPGTYHLDIYGADAQTFVYRVSNIAMTATQGIQGVTGTPGPADNTYTDLPTFKASNIASTTAQLVGIAGVPNGRFNWETSNTPYTADDLNIIKADSTALSVGAWVRQQSSGVTFKAAASAAVLRSSQDKHRDTVSVKDFGAKGDGTTDDTAAIQAALNFGSHVRFPKGVYKISSPLTTGAAGQKISGDGGLAQITNTSATDANMSCISMQHADCSVSGLSLTPGSPSAGLLYGWGIIVTANRCSVVDNHVSGMRRGGVIISNSNNCVVTGNIFTASLIVGDGTESQSVMGYDVYIQGSSSYNLVSQNQCISGCGTGIGIQTSVVSQPCFGNTISDNMIRNHPCYGIMGGYGFDPTAPVWNTLIVGNHVENISGSVYAGGTSLFYGCGIYLASLQDFVCSANTVLNTNTNRSLPRSGSDVPAAIGVSGYARGVVSGNLIRGCYHGIYYTQAGTTGADSDGVTITGNNASAIDFVGIYVTDAINATVVANRVIGSAHNQTGIHYRQTSSLQMRTCTIAYNYVSGFNNGIENTGTLAQMIARGNTIRDVATYGIYARAAISKIEGNDVVASAEGIVCTGTVTQGSVIDNVVASPVEVDSGASNLYRRGNRFSTGALSGTATLVAGAVTVSTAEVRTGDVVRITRVGVGGTAGHLSVGTVSNASGFPINSTSNTDTSVVSWEIVH